MVFNNVKLKKKIFSLKLLFLRNYSNFYDNIVFKHAIKIYKDPLNQRNLIRLDNNGKIGIYSWVNKVNGKFYIGSGNSLYLRISDYYQNWYIISRSNLYIVKAFIEYGIKNFSLVILEYSNSENLILCEQKWINLLKPEYNIKYMVKNIKNCKHVIENKKKTRKISINKKHTEEVKQVINDYCKNENNSFYDKKPLTLLKTTSKTNKLSTSRLEVEITDIKTKITTIFSSIRKAAKAIDSDIKTILRREKLQINKGLNTPYKKRYLIVIKR